METLYNILHLSGAACLIVFSATGFALIIKWWHRLSLLDTKVNFLFEQENKRFLESIGRTTKAHPTASDHIYTQKVLSGDIDPTKVSLLDFYTKSEFIPLPGNPPTPKINDTLN